MPEYYEILKRERQKRGLTQEKMASMTGLKRSTYSLYECGKREPNIETLRKIADILELSLDDLIGYTPTLKDHIISAMGPYETINDFKINQKLAMEIEKHISEERRENFSRRLTAYKTQITKQMDRLNENGQKEAVRQVEMLTKIPEYQNSPIDEQPPNNSPE